MAISVCPLPLVDIGGDLVAVGGSYGCEVVDAQHQISHYFLPQFSLTGGKEYQFISLVESLNS